MSKDFESTLYWKFSSLLFLDNMVINRKSDRIYKKQLTNALSKVVGYKIIIQKPILFPYIE